MAAASVTGSFAGISSYSYCGYGNRAGAQYVENLNSGLNSLATQGIINYSLLSGGMLKNAAVNKDTCTGSTRSTIYAYSGHGIIFDSLNNALHMNEQTGPHQTFHSYLPNQEKCPYINKKTTETTFNHKYVILYTCNQLANGNSVAKMQNTLKMLNGTRLLMGFASVMYLDSRESTYFTTLLKTNTIKNAFIEAANVYQKQRDSGDSIVRIMGYTAAANDRITSTYAYALAASGSLSSFSIIQSVTVQHNGIKI